MLSKYTGGDYQSVLFFVDHHVDREMMYSEFEAVLDSFVPIPGYASKTLQAVFLEINGQLKITAAVFFLIGFDAAGNADRKWNVPLEQLADQALPGPDLGAGPIRLCCRSQCPVEWHVQDLWDPDMSQNPNDFVLLRDIVRRNRLGFKELPLEVDDIDESQMGEIPTLAPQGSLLMAPGVELSDADKALAQSLITFIRKKVALDQQEEREQLEQQHQLMLSAQKTQFEDQQQALEQVHHEELAQMQAHMAQMQEQIEQERQTAEALRKQLQDQLTLNEQMRDSFHQEMAQSKESESSQLDALKASFQADMDLRIEAMQAEFRQQLEARDVELAYRNEQQNVLQEEIARLHEEHAALIREAGDQFISRLRDNNVSFTAYHPGAGNINIQLDSIGTYLENPVAYAAALCKASEKDYRAWLVHHQNPVCCEYSATRGDICGKKLRRVDSPAQFVAGRSDRCPLHWAFADDKAREAAAQDG